MVYEASQAVSAKERSKRHRIKRKAEGRCSRCGELAVEGQILCLECKAKARVLYEQQRANRVAYAKRYADELRKCVIDAYGSSCACCGEKEIKFLAIDHIKGKGNEHRRELAPYKDGRILYRWLVKNCFPEGFQVLCHNCNLAKGFYGECPHRTKA